MSEIHYFYRKKIDPEKPVPYCGFKWVAVKPSIKANRIILKNNSKNGGSPRTIKSLGGGYGRGEIDDNGRVVIYE